ncbi:hypothetical protein PDESU_01314 [Pontiella desulfatans]|uniref:Fatty acid desaturase domain-containing protein n=1 Tax=Pontiella desulfatans TaxID=2750659 RepID=A0A6C2TYK0_PONDE|nr:fatty acid desaturase [Pontiella desulfatans]VGO12760.1 hypothetical protein PDESU_01314 [Pontiella desulfatans]
MSNERIKWYRTPVEKTVMQELLKRNDARGLAQCLSIIALSIATGSLAYYSFHHWPWWITVATVYIHGVFYTFAGDHAAIHELSHGTPFKTKALNEFFIKLFAFCSWINYVQYRTSHMQHHQVTVHTDRDLEVQLPWTVSRLEWLGYWTVDVKRMIEKIGYIVRHSFGNLHTEWEHRLFPESDFKLRKKLFGWARVVLVGQLALAGIFMATGQWFLLLLFTFAPYIGSILAWAVTVPQHAGLPPDVPDFRMNCRSVKVDPFTRFLHWQMDYHVEHHMFAGVPFFNLKKLRKVIELDIPAYEGLLATWKKLLPVMRKQRTDPSFTTTP